MKEGNFLPPQTVEPRTIWMSVSAAVTGTKGLGVVKESGTENGKEFKWVDGRLCR
jgi:hypothetical protein